MEVRCKLASVGSAITAPASVVVHAEAQLRAALASIHLVVDVQADIEVTSTLITPSRSTTAIFSSTGATLSGGGTHRIIAAGRWSHLAVRDLTFAAGNTTGSGGAISMSSGGLVATNCRFVGNHASRHGGAVFCNTYSSSDTDETRVSPNGEAKTCVFTACTFESNTADATDHPGGAVRLYNGGGRFQDCHFVAPVSSGVNNIGGPNAGGANFTCGTEHHRGYFNCPVAIPTAAPTLAPSNGQSTPTPGIGCMSRSSPYDRCGLRTLSMGYMVPLISLQTVLFMATTTAAPSNDTPTAAATPRR